MSNFADASLHKALRELYLRQANEWLSVEDEQANRGTVNRMIDRHIDEQIAVFPEHKQAVNN